MPGNKYISNNAGQLTEVASVDASVGAGDAGKIVALNGSGVLAPSIINSKTTSAGAGDSGKIPALDGTGKLDESFMPVGIGADTQGVTASEALSAGDLVNIWSDGGSFRVRKADAATAGKAAHGFVLSAVASSGSATVYFEGSNTAVSGKTPGTQFLSTTPGASTSTAPSGASQVVQVVGFATAATVMNFQSGTPITLAA